MTLTDSSAELLEYIAATDRPSGKNPNLEAAAADESEELSASDGLGCDRLAMWVNQSRRKRRGGNKNLSCDDCSMGAPATQAGITKLSRVILLFSRSVSPNGVFSLSVA